MPNKNLRETFHLSKSFIKIVIFSIILFGVGLIASIIMPVVEPKLLSIWWLWVPIIIGYCILTKLCFSIWRQRHNHIKIDNDSIALYSYHTKIESIKWNDISEVKENNFFGRFILKDKNNKIINLEYQLENINKLIDILIIKIPNLTNKYCKIERFSRAYHQYIFSLITLIAVFGLILYRAYFHSYIECIILSVLACLIIYRLLIEFYSIRFRNRTIIILYPFWKEKITIESINDISVENIGAKSVPFVLLKLANGKTIKLNAVREGIIALFSAIKYNAMKKHS